MAKVKVKDLRKILENLDGEMGVYIMTKSNNAPCLYGVSYTTERRFAVNEIKGEKFFAIGDVVTNDIMEARTCFGERIKCVEPQNQIENGV